MSSLKQFHLDPKIDREAGEAWARLLESRADWQHFPGYVFPLERGSWLGPTESRLRYLRHDLNWHGSAWKRAIELRLWLGGSMSNAQFFANDGIVAEINRQIQQLSWKENALPPLDFPLQYHRADLDLMHWQKRVGVCLKDITNVQAEVLKTFKASILPSKASFEQSSRFWQPLGVAAILERETQALRRYLTWLREKQADSWLAQVLG